MVWCCEKCQYVGLGLWWCGALRSVTVSTLVWDCDGVCGVCEKCHCQYIGLGL